MLSEIKFAYTSPNSTVISTVSMFGPRENETLAKWITRKRKKAMGQPAKDKGGEVYIGWKYGGEIYPLESLTATNYKRLTALLKSGVPRYVRVYDNGGTSIDRYTVVYTGRKGNGEFVSMSGAPFHSQGVCQHGWAEHPIDANEYGFSPARGRLHPSLGRHISFHDLPEDCQKVVLRDYRAAWDLPLPLSESLLTQNREVKVEEGRREPLPEMPLPADTPDAVQIVEHHDENGSPHYTIVTSNIAMRLQELGLTEHCERCYDGQFHAEGLSPTFTWEDFLIEVEVARTRDELGKQELLNPVVFPNQLSGEYEQLGKGHDIEDEEILAYEQSKMRPATEEDKKAVMARAVRLGIFPSPVAQTQTILTEQEQQRLWMARKAVEQEYMAQNWKRLLPIYAQFYWNDAGYCLGLIDIGVSDSDNKPDDIHYVLIGPTLVNVDGVETLDIIFEGGGFRPSPLYDSPIGPKAAEACLSLLIGQSRAADDYLNFNERQVKFFENEAELIDESWPVQKELEEAPAGRDQYGDPVPTDLVDIPGPTSAAILNEEGVARIIAAKWYEVYGPDHSAWLAVSSAEVDFLSEREEEWPEGITFRRVDDALKRYSEEDGFYHA